MVKSALTDARADQRISFITAVNTLGCCCVGIDGHDSGVLALPGEGMGGLAGTAIHPLALGNVKLHSQIVADGPLGHLEIIGVGGVRDGQGYKNMRSVGANYVALATAFGQQPRVFFEIAKDIRMKWHEYDPPKN